MNPTDWNRFQRSIEWAVRSIEKDAFCFGYGDEPEYLEFLEVLKTQQEKLKGERHHAEDPAQPR